MPTIAQQSTTAFLKKAFSENRLLYQDIDNQAKMPLENFTANNVPGRIEPFLAACRENAGFTNQISELLPTMHIFMSGLNYDFKPKDSLQYVEETVFQKGVYNSKTAEFVKVGNHIMTSNNPNLWPLTIDALNPNFDKGYVWMKEAQGAYQEPYLAEFMQTKNWDVTLVSGLYLEACVKATISGAKIENITPILVVDRVLSFGDFDFNNKNILQQKSQEMAIKMAENMGIHYTTSSELLNILKH